jgi:uncharacterized membrane protein
MKLPKLLHDAYEQFQNIKNNLGILYKVLIFITPFLTIAYYFIFVFNYLPSDSVGKYGGLTLAYFIPPAGKESIILAMLSDNKLGASLPVSIVWSTIIIMDLISAIIVAYNWWFPEMIIKRISLLRRGYDWLQRKAEKFKKKKLLTLSLIVFMIIPFQGSGGISTPILARLLGVKAKKTVMIVFVGSTITTTLFTLSWLGFLNVL